MRPMIVNGVAALLLTGAAAVADLPVEVYVNGVRQDFQPPAQVRHGVAYAPLRAVAEAIGAEVTWDEPAHRVVVRHAQRSIRVSLGEGIAVEGRLLVPLRWFAEALGAEVTWEKDRGRVVIGGLSALPRDTSRTAQPSAQRYMEVWPLVLTCQTFLLRVPTDQDEPERLALKVDIISEDGRTVRVAHATAHWQRVQWPQDVAVHAAVNDELPATQPHAAWVAEIPIEPTEPGTYHFAAEVTQGAMAGTSFSAPEVIVHEQPDWLHARAGLEGLDRVLAPWTPVEMEVAVGTHVVSCWNRQIILKDDSLVDQITSGDHMLLAAPLELDAWDAAGDQLKAQGSWTPVEQREVHVSLTRRWASDQSHLDVTLTKEYDGLTWLEMRIGGGVGIERLDLVLPLVRETVPLIYYFPDVP